MLKKLNSINPFNGRIIGSVILATQGNIIKTVENARRVFKMWRDITVEKKIEFVKKFTNEVVHQKQKIAKLITLEMGKPYREALREVDFTSNCLEYYISKAPHFLKTRRGIILEPYGVCAVITPWNFPLLLPVVGIVPNILVGNTVVFKPSENTPLVGAILGKILGRLLPFGVVNVIYGGEKEGKIMLNSQIDLVWFTGSSKVGHEIYKKCAQKFIPCILEMGGSSPAIVFSDVNIDTVVSDIISSRFLNAGQVCTAVKRLFVEKSIFETFVKRLIAKVSILKVGNPFSNDVDIGPIVSKKQLRLLFLQLDDAIKKGATVFVGGRSILYREYRELRKSIFWLPTLVINVNFKMRLMQEEVFGPILPVMPFQKINEVIEMANNTIYGLSAEVYTSNTRKAEEIARKLEVGAVSINTPYHFSLEAPHSGYKMSGLARQGGEFSFLELCRIKYVSTKETK